MSRYGRNKLKKDIAFIKQGLAGWSLVDDGLPEDKGYYIIARLPYTERCDFASIGVDWRDRCYRAITYFDGEDWALEMIADNQGQPIGLHPRDIVAFIRMPDLPEEYNLAHENFSGIKNIHARKNPLNINYSLKRWEQNGRWLRNVRQ